LFSSEGQKAYIQAENLVSMVDSYITFL
jgi:hypothetical protein